MTARAGSAPDLPKRRQAVQVTFFLLAVAAGTIALFHVLRRDLVAYRRGHDAMVRGDFAVAATELERAWTAGYQSPRLRLDLARSLLAAGRRNEAFQHYYAILGPGPADGWLLEVMAGLYQERGEPEKGIELLQRAGPPERLSVPALTRLGDLQQQAGRHAAAAATYRLAVARAPDEVELQVRLGIVLSWIGERPDSIAALRRALALEPRHRLAQLYLARVLMWDGRLAEAVTEYRRALPE